MSSHAASRTNGTLGKGVLAAGAAAALGLGLFSANGGSFALWQDSATLGNGTTITSGRLDLTTGEGTWQVDPAGAAGTDSIDPEHVTGYQVVPGDRFVYTQPVTLDAEGDNLLARLDVTLPSIVSAAGNEQLAGALDVTFTATNTDDESVTVTETEDGNGKDTVSGELLLDPSDSAAWLNEPVTVTVAVTLPEDVAGTTAQDMTVTLNPATITATQVLPGQDD